MEAELQLTLDELCADLLSDACDQQSVLQSLTQLALRFPQAQRILGRSLAALHHGDEGDGAFHPLPSLPPVRRKGKAAEFPPKLAVLAKRFLYRRETALSTIALLTALANENAYNQQRIVRSVVGVRLVFPTTTDPARDVRTIVFDAGKIKKKRQKSMRSDQHPPLVLYALTVPDSVKHAFRKWRKRQQLLQNHRIPSGAPPEQGGVPKPCHCNECLGAEQFLPTWQLHFRDLSRWRRDPESGEDELSQTKDAAAHPRGCSLTSSAFFQIFLQDFRLCTHSLVQSEDSGGDKKSIHAYYFVPQSDTPESDTSPAPSCVAPAAFNPLQHVCAIAIAPDITVAEAVRVSEKSRSRVSGCTSSQSPVPSDENCCSEVRAYEAIQRVLLLEGHAELPLCSHERDASEDAHTVAEPTANSAAARGVARFLGQIEEAAAGEQVTKSTIEAALIAQDDGNAEMGAEDEATQTPPLTREDRTILHCVLAFLDNDDVVSLETLRDIMVEPGDIIVAAEPIEEPLEPQDDPHGDDDDADHQVATEPLQDKPETSSFSFQITACVDTQELVFTCTSDGIDAGAAQLQVFAASVSLETLVQREEPSRDLDPLSLLCVDESELRAILAHCQVCVCRDGFREPGVSVLYLRAQQLSAALSQHDSELLEAAQDLVEHPDAERQHTSKALSAASAPVPGLSHDVSNRLLAKLEAQVSSFSSSFSGSAKSAFMAKFSDTLARIIKSCNARITALAISHVVDGSATSDVHRKAGMERCRQCRDLLIQLGKKVKLVLESSPETASAAASDVLAADQLTRITKLVRKSVALVRTQSESVQAWETPDARVDKLQLSRHVWASGFPDPEFYRERDATELENKKKQRQLTQQLMDRRVKQQQQHR